MSALFSRRIASLATRSAALAVAALVPVLSPAVARADDLGPAVVDKVERLSADLRYAEARKTCVEGFAAGGFGLDTMRQLSRLCAIVQATLGEGPAAEAAWRLALALDPAVRPPDDAPPRVLSSFERARAWWADKEPLAVEHPFPVASSAGAGVELRLRVVSDPLKIVAGAAAYYRLLGSTDWTRAPPAKRVGEAFVVVAPAEAGAPGVEYWIGATDAAGSIVAAHGSATVPLRVGGTIAGTDPVVPPETLPIVPPRRVPLALRWWFWAGIGVVAAGIAAGLTAAALAARADTTTFVFRFEVP